MALPGSGVNCRKYRLMKKKEMCSKNVKWKRQWLKIRELANKKKEMK